MKKLLLILVLFFLFSKTYAQNKDFENQLITHKKLPDSIKKNNSFKLEKQLLKIDEKQIDDIKLKKELKLALVEIYHNNNKRVKEITIIKSLLNDDSIELTSTEKLELLLRLKYLYYFLKLYPEIFVINKKVKKILDEDNIEVNARHYVLNSKLYWKLNDVDKAISEAKKEIVLIKKSKKRDSSILASLYNNVGIYYKENKNTDSALIYFDKSLKEASKALKGYEEKKYRTLEGLVNGNIGEVYILQKKYHEAIPFLLIDIENNKDDDDLYPSNLNNYNLLIECYLNTNDLDNAKYYLEEGNKEFKSLNNPYYFKNKAQYYYLKKNLDSLNYYSLKSFEIKDSIDKVKKISFLNSSQLIYNDIEELKLEQRFNLEMKNQEIYLKNKRNRIVLLLTILFFLALIYSVYNLLLVRKNRNLIILKNKEINEKNRIIEKDLLNKEVLLKDIHHRVKNNLHLVNALLRNQSKSIEDNNILNVFKEAQNKILSILLLHEKIYLTKDIEFINFREYITSLINEIINTYNIDVKPTVKFDAIDSTIKLNIEKLMPLSLIINEIISNSFKYAFIDKQKGEIKLSVLKNKKRKVIEVIIGDNGIGNNSKGKKGFGGKLIEAFTKQLNGNIKVLGNMKGTYYKLEFPI